MTPGRVGRASSERARRSLTQASRPARPTTLGTSPGVAPRQRLHVSDTALAIELDDQDPRGAPRHRHALRNINIKADRPRTVPSVSWVSVNHHLAQDRARSTGVRKELGELLGGFHVSEGFARPVVEAAGDSGEVLGGMD
jgi:hypothetical protein